MKNGEIMHSQADNMGLKKLGWIPCIVDKQSIEHVFSDWGGYLGNFLPAAFSIHCKLPFKYRFAVNMAMVSGRA